MIGLHPTSNAYVGVSIGNQVGTSTSPASDLSAGGDSGSLGLVYENGWAANFDLEDTSITFSPNGSGGFTYSISCGGPSRPACVAARPP